MSTGTLGDLCPLSGGEGEGDLYPGRPHCHLKSVNLESVAPFPSSTDPWVHFHVCKEVGSPRLWAFSNREGPTSNGYVILFQGWWRTLAARLLQIYDFAH